jgi:hypothetical protein
MPLDILMPALPLEQGNLAGPFVAPRSLTKA